MYRRKSNAGIGNIDFGDCTYSRYFVNDDQKNANGNANECRINNKLWPRSLQSGLKEGNLKNKTGIFQTFGTVAQPDLTSGNLLLTLDLFKVFGGAQYQVLDTDYTSYSVVYSCSHPYFGLGQMEFLWIYTRKPVPTFSADFKKLEKKGLSIIQDKF